MGPSDRLPALDGPRSLRRTNIYKPSRIAGNGMTLEDDAQRYSRREFIKRVIASGAVASAAVAMGSMAGCASRRAAVAGSVERLVSARPVEPYGRRNRCPGRP